MPTSPDRRWKTQAVPLVAAWILTILGLVVVMARHAPWGKFVQFLPGLAPMQFNTAMGFVLCGLGLGATVMGLHRTALALGIAVVAIGTLDLIEFVYASQLGVGRLVVEQESA